MGQLIPFLQGLPLAVLFLGAHFLLYSPVAWPVLVGRAACGRFGRRETALFAFFAGFLFLEWLQLFVDGFNFLGKDVYGLPRYFGTFAPLLWLWLAKAFAFLWMWPWNRIVRGVVRVAVVLVLGWVLVAQNIQVLADAYRFSAMADSKIAAVAAAEVIQADYMGPARQEVMMRTGNEYFTARRPVVFSDFSGLLAWKVGGQSEGPNFKNCPYRPDYVFRRATVDSEKGTASVDLGKHKDFEFLQTVRGLKGLGPEFDPDGQGSVWFLFRRKGVPCRAK